MKQVGIVVVEFQPVQPGGSSGSVYRVVQLKNTIEWFIGQDLSRQEVLSIIGRTGKKEVEMIVKGVEFGG